MRITKNILVLLILIAIVIPAVAADTDNSQNAVGTVVNSDNVDQTINNNNNQNEQDANGVIVGDDNTQIVVNDNSKDSVTNNNGDIITNNNGEMVTNNNGDAITNNYGNTITSTSSSTSVSATYEAPEYTYHDLLEKNAISSRIVSVYSGRAAVYPLNYGRTIKRGEMYNLSYHAACPILTYVINTREKDSVNHQDSAPVFDDIYGTFDHQSLPVIKGSVYDPAFPTLIMSIDSDYATQLAEDISPQNEIVFTITDDGKYSVVLDTRPSQHRNGRLTKVLDSTCDITFETGYVGFDETFTEVRTSIGETSVYPVDKKGHIIATI